MSDDDLFARKIATLSATDTFDGRAVHLGPSGDDDAVVLVLHAIDDTMLLRDAVFSVGDSFVTLRISGKRLLGVVAVSDDLTLGSPLIDHALTAASQDEIAQVGALLRALTRAAGVLKLERQVVDPSAKPSHLGVSSDGLAEVWQMEPTQDASDPLTRFAARCALLSEAMILSHDGQTLESTGSATALKTLRSSLEHDGLDRVPHAPGGTETDPRLQVLDATAPKGKALAMARVGNRHCAALISTDAVATLCAAWATAFANGA